MRSGAKMQAVHSKPEIIVVPDARQLAKAGAACFEQTVANAVRSRGEAAIAISGGSSPRQMYRRLAGQPYVDRIPWKRIHLFWVDERMVATGDPASNFTAAREDFISKVTIPADQVHPMPVFDPTTAGADAYSRELRSYFGSNQPVFDLIFLGIGSDGHTASLFPDQVHTHKDSDWVLSVKGGNPDVHRLTLNYPVLNRAMAIIFLVSGRDKAEMVHTLLSDDETEFPPQRIQPQGGRLIWLIDQSAASLLPREMRSY
jgi:6-phosphogluconolactonase